MSYVALYRKFRPLTFDEVKGQDAIVTTLKNQVMNDHIQHAYLFSGTRGTGKTSVAKILARAVNCEHPVDGNPDNTCPVCEEILAGSSMNVVEIDAASNNGVDNIREIIDQVQYRPTSGRYKVYIIDEVHMLSQGAFNALLKTLEEPPEYVIFILATTEASKIPLTITSRCQRYDFRRIDLSTMTDHLTALLEKEGAEAEEKALRYLARAADGSFRDALSLLDQCLSFHPEGILTYDQVLKALGASGPDQVRALTSALSKGSVTAALSVFEEMIGAGKEIGQIVTDLIWHLRDLLLLQKTDDAGSELIEATSEQLLMLKEDAAALPQAFLMRSIRLLSNLLNDLRHASNKRTLTEIAIIRLATPSTEQDAESLTERIRMLEEEVEELRRTGISAPLYRDEAPPEAAMPEPEEEEESGPAAPEDLQTIRAEWNRIVADVTDGFKKQMLAEAIPKFNGRNHDNKLYLEFRDENAERCVRDEGLKQALVDLIRRRYKKDVEIEMHLAKESPAGLRTIRIEEQLKRIKMPVMKEE